MDHDPAPPSMITRLLEEISWEKAVNYRRGGRGMENVLTAEVLIGLDLLPRTHFFAAMIGSCSGADEARTILAGQAESARMSLLPGDMSVNPAEPARKFIVQPDALILGPQVFAFVEAKRIRTSAFQPEQLAREYVTVMSNAGERTPLLFLLGVEPPVSVRGLGKMSLHDAVRLHLPAVLNRAGDRGLTDRRRTDGPARRRRVLDLLGEPARIGEYATGIVLLRRYQHYCRRAPHGEPGDRRFSLARLRARPMATVWPPVS